MSEAKHTPGPWTISRYDDRPEMIVVKNGKEVETMVAYAYEGDVGIEEQRANARLIVRAPELFAALKDMVDWQCKHCTCKEEPWSETEECPSFCQELKYKRLIDEVKGGAE